MDRLYEIAQLDKIESGTIALLGILSDENSSHMKGPAKAPPIIRNVLTNGASNLFAENGINLSKNPLIADAGDIEPPAGYEGIQAICEKVKGLLAKGFRLLALGGDHAVSFPIVKAYAEQYPNLTIVHLDAHPDLYDTFDQNPFSHASPFARIMENKLAANLIQIGIRGMNDVQRDQVRRFNATVIEMKDWHSDLPIKTKGPVYLSLDMDVLDPAFAPGVSHHEPGGLATREVIRLIQRLDGPIVGADIVEYNPERDAGEITAAAAAKLLKEVAGAMIASISP